MVANHEQDKILYLESLRGIAAMTVAILHFNVGSILNNTFTSNGWLMVDFFFVLSGFVIALNYQGKIKTLSHLFNFQARRFLRLYPLHLLTLFLFLGIELAKYVVEVNFGLIANNRAFSTNNLSSFVQNIFLVQNLLNDKLTWNIPSWSISSEFYTYIVFALVTLLFNKHRQLLVLVAALIAAIGAYYLFDNSMSTSNGFTRCLYGFFLGVICFNFSNRFSLLVPNLVSYFVFLVSILVVCLSEGTQSKLSILIPIVFALLIISLVMSRGKNYLKIALDNRFLIYLGTISYGVYMTHAAVWWVFHQCARFIFDFPTFVDEEGAVKVAFNNVVIANIAMILGLCVIIFLAHFSYKIIEMPANNFRHKLGKFN